MRECFPRGFSLKRFGPLSRCIPEVWLISYVYYFIMLSRGEASGLYRADPLVYFLFSTVGRKKTKLILLKPIGVLQKVKKYLSSVEMIHPT